MMQEMSSIEMIETNGGSSKIIEKVGDAIIGMVVEKVVVSYYNFLKNQDYTYNPSTYKHPYRTDLN